MGNDDKMEKKNKEKKTSMRKFLKNSKGIRKKL